MTGRWPRVTGLTSYLSGCIRFCSEVIPFVGTASIEEVDELCQARSLPAIIPSLRTLLVRAGRAFWWGGPTGRSDRVLVCAVATKTLWGNCVGRAVRNLPRA
jgi:hypothetical protein